jgi:flagellar biosynthetic protein FliR
MVMTSQMFVIGIKIAAPIVSALFLTIVALGILNRAVPQVNVFVVGMPLQFAVGVFMLILVMPLYLSYLQVIFRNLFQEIHYMLQLMKG